MTSPSTSLRPAQSTVQLDDANFRVTEWRFAPGTETGWHAHALDYVVVPMSTGELTLNTRDAVSTFQLTAGASYTRAPGPEHNIANHGATEIVFIEVERK
ncbi:cupin domain-containing protein [Specibacter cremeus]|uniref:cupin domain-containing protein n=1 Tax=Specibacter cremeus TaxID=1629051 RepID=UPI000F79CBFC|nr:cupin domain-containing protein [Specibacter cremeus]